MVQITDQYGNPVSGATVNWAAATGGGSVSSLTSTTNSSGDASINATLGSSTGSNTFTATVSGLTGSPVTFTATAVVPTYLVLVSGNNQTGTVGTQLSAPLVVQVQDQSHNPVAGITVHWAVAGGGGSVSSSQRPHQWVDDAPRRGVYLLDYDGVRTDLIAGGGAMDYGPIWEGWYPEFLNRPADSGGLSYWLNELQSGAMDDQLVIAHFMGGTEGFGMWS